MDPMTATATVTEGQNGGSGATVLAHESSDLSSSSSLYTGVPEGEVQDQGGE